MDRIFHGKPYDFERYITVDVNGVNIESLNRAIGMIRAELKKAPSSISVTVGYLHSQDGEGAHFTLQYEIDDSEEADQNIQDPMIKRRVITGKNLSMLELSTEVKTKSDLIALLDGLSQEMSEINELSYIDMVLSTVLNSSLSNSTSVRLYFTPQRA